MSRLSPVLLFGEYVARTAHCEDTPRLLRIILDGRANARDVHVDRAIELFECGAFGEVHQRIAREHASGALGKREQQRVLIAREWLVVPIDAYLPRAAINF